MIDKYFLLLALLKSKKPTALISQTVYDNHFTRQQVPILGRTIIGEGNNASISFLIDRAKAIKVLQDHGMFLKKGSSLGINGNIQGQP